MKTVRALTARLVLSQVRALWYTVMAHIEFDEESQKNGWVALVYNVGPYPLHYFDRELYAKLLKIAKVLPLRIVGYHSCFNDLKLRTVTPFTLLFMGKETRARYRSHIGKFCCDQASLAVLLNTWLVKHLRWTCRVPLRTFDLWDSSSRYACYNGRTI